MIGDRHNWADSANHGREEYSSPLWAWDCGKLDYDGPLVRFSSRFYPPDYSPKQNKWSGKVTILVINKEIFSKPFEAETLDQLKDKVDAFTQEFIGLAIHSLRTDAPM